MRYPRKVLTNTATCCLLGCMSPVMAGTAFGIYDARTLAMGGVSVASANNDNAQFYNAALLAFNDEIEERTTDARLWFPMIVPQVSESAIEFEEVASDDLSQAVTNSVNTFNATPDPVAAQAVVDATATLDASLASFDDEDLFADMYLGMGISEPGKFQGAGFFFGVRLLAGGQASNVAADRTILAAYRDGLSFVASGGSAGTERPEIFDANGALIDPGDQFTSTVTSVGAAVTEVGVAMSQQMQLFGQAVAAGISLKVLDIDTFENTERAVDGRVDVDSNSESDTNVNFDVGIIREIGESWRIGIAVKDIVPHNYKTSLGSIVRLRPRPRFGAAYQSGRLQFAMDVDLTTSQPLGGERPVQEIAIGAEWSFDSPIRLRTGYRHDIKSVRDGVVSAGIGTRWKRLVVDLAYAQGSKSQAAALQFGVAF